MYDVRVIVTPSEPQRRGVAKCLGPGWRLVADGGNGHLLLAAHSSPALTTHQYTSPSVNTETGRAHKLMLAEINVHNNEQKGRIIHLANYKYK